ncbi:MAG: hypothetical protein ACOCXH_09500 [Cyclobacteriaceae bacterium]
MSELFRFDKLIDHYRLHLVHGKDNSLTFWQFLWMHYNPFSQKHDMQHEHNLPLYNQTSTLIYLYELCHYNFSKISIVSLLKKSFKLPDHYNFLFVSQVLHPPKF